MSALSRIFRLEFNSSILRFFLSLIYRPGRFYKIPAGQLKGVKIWYDRSINYHAVLGLWERRNFDLLDKVVKKLYEQKKGLVIYDVGANIGLFSLFFKRYTQVEVVAFEAAAETLEKLKRNVDANEVGNIMVVSKAVADVDGTVDFFLTHHHKSSLLYAWASDRGVSEVKKVTVPAVSLDTFAKENPARQPDLIKIDVEGGGSSVLAGAKNVIESHRPIILFESHLPVEDAAVSELLLKYKYDAFRINDEKWVTKKSANYTDPEGVWGTMFLIPEERVSILNEILK